jgi:formylglycine-generating enzyme required for sulfatase activity/TolB-like protein
MKTIRILAMAALAALAFAASDNAGFAQTMGKLVAVLALTNRAGITDDEAEYLTNNVRTVASQMLPNDKFIVMTRENMEALLPQGMDLKKCAEASCEVDTGQKLGAEYIVTGDIVTFAGKLHVELRLHHVPSRGMLPGANTPAGSLEEQDSLVTAAAKEVMRSLLEKAGVAPAAHAAGGGRVAAEGRIGQAPAAWEAPHGVDTTVVDFESAPKGAFVEADGAPLCQTTPCSRALATGATVTISMKLLRYKPREETIGVKKGTRVNWTLEPNFGRVTVTSEPSGLAVTIDGKTAGRTPLADYELDPGPHDVVVTDPRYYDQGEKIDLKAGEQRRVAVTLPRREGALAVTARNARGDDLEGEVYVDGVKVGAAPGTIGKVLIGRHNIEVRTAQGAWRNTVEVKEREETAVAAEVTAAAAPPAAAVSAAPAASEKSVVIQLLPNQRRAVAAAPAGAIITLTKAQRRHVGRTWPDAKSTTARIFADHIFDRDKTTLTLVDGALASTAGSVEAAAAGAATATAPAPAAGGRPGMVRVPGGAFLMGCSPDDAECGKDEKPAHQVTVAAFWMDATPVTQAQFQSAMGRNPSKFAGCADCPVETVKWDEAADYCAKVGKRLPTEAEWEFAARGGTAGPRYGEVDAIAWHSKNSDNKTHPVAQKKPNAYGLYDMLGNVYEWCADWYNKKTYATSPSDNPKGPSATGYRVLRGGGWNDNSSFGRASYRTGYKPSEAEHNLGFRCVQD